MGVNRIDYFGETLINLTSLTATAADVARGKIGIDKAGNLFAGTMTAGGSSDNIETGVYTPTTDIARPTIRFSKTHSTVPTIVIFGDATGTLYTTSNSNFSCVFVSHEDAFGAAQYVSSSSKSYGYVYYRYRANSATSITASNTNITSSKTGTTTANSAAVRYWVDESSFTPGSASTSRYWRAGRTYMWAAIWL